MEKLKQAQFIPLLAILFAIGVPFFFVEALQRLLPLLLPIFLLLNLALLFFYNKNYLKVFFLIFGLGLLVEIIGVNTGFPFGEYSYGNLLGLKIFQTPVLIGVNWFIVMVASYGTARLLQQRIRHLPETKVLTILLTGLLTLALDILIEPVAIAVNMWRWTGNNGVESVPIQNYLSWFVIAVIFALILDKSDLKLDEKFNSSVYVLLAMFFGIINLGLLTF